MLAAEEDFDMSGKKFKAGSFIIPNADRAALEPQLKSLGITAVASAATLPTVKTHDLDVPRIGYVHSWSRTQDEGWNARRSRPLWRAPSLTSPIKNYGKAICVPNTTC